ncbi:hypothetical protein, partial [Escherichia coli]
GFGANASGRAGSSGVADASSGSQPAYGASSASQGGGSLFDSSATGQNSGRGGAGPGNVLDGVRITADSVNNTLLIYASQEQYRIIEQTIREVD